MPDLRAEPDLETLVIGYLKDDVLLTALVPAAMISGRLRRGLTSDDVALRVTRVGGGPVEDSAAHVLRIRFQIDAFAPDQTSAWEVASVALLELRRITAAELDGAVVTGVETGTGITNDDDPDSDLARYRFDVVLYAHARAA